jgi:hypothetical protein
MYINPDKREIKLRDFVTPYERVIEVRDLCKLG